MQPSLVFDKEILATDNNLLVIGYTAWEGFYESNLLPIEFTCREQYGIMTCVTFSNCRF
jgi:hypothetical protein